MRMRPQTWSKRQANKAARRKTKRIARIKRAMRRDRKFHDKHCGPSSAATGQLPNNDGQQLSGRVSNASAE